MEIVDALGRVLARKDLSADEIAAVFGRVMDGLATPAQIGGLLVALRMKGETPDEIAGAARAMRARATRVACPDPDHAVDTCGTGGDASGSLNISTLAAIVAAAAGVRVAKHGNRAQSSRSGSADVLEALGVETQAPLAVVEKCLAEIGITFLFAPTFHAATRHAAGPRRELGTRTLFNLLGPLTNPAGVGNQVVGVYAQAWVEPMALALGQLGARRAFVIHGEGGLDEVAVAGATEVAEWRDGACHKYQLAPSAFGLGEEDPAGLRGGDARDNATAIRAVLHGARGAPRAAALMEAALALVAAGVAADVREGAERAAVAIDDGLGARTLELWVRLSKEPV